MINAYCVDEITILKWNSADEWNERCLETPSLLRVMSNGRRGLSGILRVKMLPSENHQPSLRLQFIFPKRLMPCLAVPFSTKIELSFRAKVQKEQLWILTNPRHLAFRIMKWSWLR